MYPQFVVANNEFELSEGMTYGIPYKIAVVYRDSHMSVIITLYPGSVAALVS